MTDLRDVIIIGAGHNGLVCAAYLARAGKNVLCLEAAERAGGMAARRTILNDYHFPGLAHVAYPLAASIQHELRLRQFGYAACPAAGTVVIDAERGHLALGADSVSGDELPEADARAYPAFRQQYLGYARALRPLFEHQPPRLKDMEFSDKATFAKTGWNLRFGLGREATYEFLRVAAINIYDVLNETFTDDRLKGAIAADALMGSSMGPRTPGTVLTWLQRLQGEVNGPQFVQADGSAQLVQALVQSAQDAGATLRLNAAVERILVENGKARGVQLESGEVLEASVIVSNADPRITFSKLIGAPLLDAMFAHRVTQIRGAGVVAKLYLALAGVPQFPGLSQSQLGGRLLIAPSMQYIERAFNHSKYGEYSDHPVLEITLPSLQNPALAPAGHHTMSVNVAYAPYSLAGGWEAQKAEFAEKLIALLSRYSPDLKSFLQGYELLTPADIEKDYRAVQGHWHHGELSIHQSFMMRPLYGAAQYSTPVEQLFLCGAGSHPGGGLTGLPGRNAAKRILALERS